MTHFRHECSLGRLEIHGQAWRILHLANARAGGRLWYLLCFARAWAAERQASADTWRVCDDAGLLPVHKSRATAPACTDCCDWPPPLPPPPPPPAILAVAHAVSRAQIFFAMICSLSAHNMLPALGFWPSSSVDVYKMPWNKGVSVRAEDGALHLSFVGIYEVRGGRARREATTTHQRPPPTKCRPWPAIAGLPRTDALGAFVYYTIFSCARQANAKSCPNHTDVKGRPTNVFCPEFVRQARRTDTIWSTRLTFTLTLHPTLHQTLPLTRTRILTLALTLSPLPSHPTRAAGDSAVRPDYHQRRSRLRPAGGI